MSHNYTSDTGNNAIINCIQGELTEITYSTMGGDVKKGVIYLLSFLLVINCPVTVVKDST